MDGAVGAADASNRCTERVVISFNPSQEAFLQKLYKAPQIHYLPWFDNDSDFMTQQIFCYKKGA